MKKKTRDTPSATLKTNEKVHEARNRKNKTDIFMKLKLKNSLSNSFVYYEELGEQNIFKIGQS